MSADQDHARQVLREYRDYLMWIKNVVAVGISAEAGVPVIAVTVLAGQAADLPDKLDGVRVVRRDSGPIVPQGED